MKKPTYRTPSYVFILVAVILSWGLAIAKVVVSHNYPQLSAKGLHLGDLQYQYIFAFLF
ncbi:hypothetical protein BH09BAC1_BH09BAC1_27720 [soil metagenome]